MNKVEVPLTIAHRLLAGAPLLLLAAQRGELTELTTLPWAAPLSTVPPQLGFSFYPSHFIVPVLEVVEEFTLNVVCEDILKQALECAKAPGEEFDKLRLTALRLVDAASVESPLVEQCVAHLECGLTNRRQVGDHLHYEAQVLAACADDDVFGEHWLHVEHERRPLTHLGKGVYGWLQPLEDETES